MTQAIERFDVHAPRTVADHLAQDAWEKAMGEWMRPSSKGASRDDTLMELEDLLTLTGSDVIRPAVPSAAAISQMDEALEWVSWITDPGQRRVVLFWMMVHPISRRHLFSWRDIGSRMSVSHVTAKRWHSSGLAVITRKIFGQVNFPLSKCSKMQCF